MIVMCGIRVEFYDYSHCYCLHQCRHAVDRFNVGVLVLFCKSSMLSGSSIKDGCKLSRLFKPMNRYL